MKDQRKTEIKVGITVIVSLIIFLWILGWAKNFSFTSNEKTLEIEFKNASGLEVGDYVTVNGVRKGNVQDIEIKADDVLVKATISNEVNLRKDAKFYIAMVDMMGGKKIEINPGNSQSQLDYNKIQQGSFNADIPAVMSLVGSMQDDLISTLKDVKVTLSSLNNYLTDKKLNENVKMSLANLNKLTQKLNLMMDENRTNINKLTSNSVELTDEAKNFIKNNQNEITKSIQEASNVLRKTDSLMTKLNEFSNEVKDQKNNLGKLMYDKNLYTNLTQSIKQVDELTKLLLEQLKKEGLKVDAKINLF
jgi:phospholipid/cholesterol/gamma-HCH transport system substrate-binding protein